MLFQLFLIAIEGRLLDCNPQARFVHVLAAPTTASISFIEKRHSVDLEPKSFWNLFYIKHFWGQMHVI